MEYILIVKKIRNVEEEQDLNLWQDSGNLVWKAGHFKMGVGGREKRAIQGTGGTNMPGDR